jgi:hypothetical protein
MVVLKMAKRENYPDKQSRIFKVFSVFSTNIPSLYFVPSINGLLKRSANILHTVINGYFYLLILSDSAIKTLIYQIPLSSIENPNPAPLCPYFPTPQNKGIRAQKTGIGGY